MVFRSRAERQRHLAAQRTSSLSVAAYCKREGIPQNTFYNWRRRPGARKFDRQPAAPVSFLQLPAQPTEVQRFDLTLPNGSRLIMPVSCDQAFLRRTIRMVSGLRPR